MARGVGPGTSRLAQNKRLGFFLEEMKKGGISNRAVLISYWIVAVRYVCGFVDGVGWRRLDFGLRGSRVPRAQ